MFKLSIIFYSFNKLIIFCTKFYIKSIKGIIRSCNLMVKFWKFTLNIKIYQNFEEFIFKLVWRRMLFIAWPIIISIKMNSKFSLKSLLTNVLKKFINWIQLLKEPHLSWFLMSSLYFGLTIHICDTMLLSWTKPQLCWWQWMEERSW